MNKELLFNLYAIHSPSGGEKKMRRFIRKYITEHCGDVEMETDKFGNLLCTKGVSDTYPCLASHMDQVQHAHSRDFQVVEGDDVVFGYSAKSREQQGLGADDKNGIWICLECLRMYDVLKVAFFVKEESGCQGSGAVDISFFKDCRFIVQPDRKGSHDLITSMFCGRVCSDDFINAMHSDAYGYKPATGSITDVGELVERGVGISCLNLSCGYYEAHTEHEFTVISDLVNCLFFVCDIINTCTDVYPFAYAPSYYPRYDYDWYGWKGYGSYFNNKSKPSVKKEEKFEDDEETYYNDGYYDEDFKSMQDYLSCQPDTQLEDILSIYKELFHASDFFPLEKNAAKYEVTCEEILTDIYYSAKEELTPRFWDDDRDDDDEEAQPSAIEMKKVS